MSSSGRSGNGSSDIAAAIPAVGLWETVGAGVRAGAAEGAGFAVVTDCTAGETTGED